MDTGAFYALADRRDPAHVRARKYFESCEAALVTTDFIFAETMSLLTKRLGKAVAVAVGDGIRRSPRFRVEEPPPAVREGTWKIFAGQRDKDYDLIDCISIATMESLGIREVLGFDRHFLQYGFQLHPGN
jgi:predicted nucleic acid-binding protein